MNLLKRFLCSSIGKKQVMGATGILLVGFLMGHLGGNLLLLKGPAAFDSYADHLVNFPLLIPVEIGLLALFLTHIIMGTKLKLENWAARPQGYAVQAAAGGSTFASSTMIYTGLLTFVFLVVHIETFKYQQPHGGSLFGWVTSRFRVPIYTGFYVLALISLGIHLSHGIRSAFQTFGVEHPAYTPLIKVGGLLLAAALGTAFTLLPIWGFVR